MILGRIKKCCEYSLDDIILPAHSVETRTCLMLIFSQSFFVLHLSRFLFTDYNRLSSVGGETSMAEMIATLSDACEREFGFLATRLFRVFKHDETHGVSVEYVA